MPRPPRPQHAGAIYHLTARGVRGSEIFRDDGDRVVFLSRLLRTLDSFAWDLHAWCLLSTHFHLLVTTRAATLGAGMQALNSRYAESFNGRHALVGHVFERRYDHRLVETDEHLLNAYAYIALNPVRAGICARPDEWWWSSYAGVLTGREGRVFAAESLLAHFADRGGRRGLQRLVERALAEERFRRADMLGV